jgi:hypothetical protein
VAFKVNSGFERAERERAKQAKKAAKAAAKLAEDEDTAKAGQNDEPKAADEADASSS